MAKLKDKNRKAVNKYITIYDPDVWQLIEKIMEVPEYSKSFNKVANEALKYGVVELYQKLYVATKQVEDEEISITELVEKSKEEKVIEDYMKEIVVLIKEGIINATIVKSTTNSMHEMLKKSIGKEIISPIAIEGGLYARTPKYLESYEIRALRNLRGDDD